MKLKIKDQIPDTEIFQLVDGEPQKSKLRKILGNGKLEKKIEIESNMFSKSAVEKLEKAGGKAIFI